jgi:glycosyltransferase involved in cell wall biosynthesis
VPISPSSLRIAFLTHEPFYPPSGGGSAEAVYLVEEMVRRGHEVHLFCPQIDDAVNVAKKFGIHLHQFTAWQMGRYAKVRNLKYLAYPFFLERMVMLAARRVTFDLIFSQHAISAVAAGKLKARLRLPVVMNFPDLLTGFMETWPSYVMPRPMVRALVQYEARLPVRYSVDGVLAISDMLADLFVERGFDRQKIQPIYFGYAAEHFPFQTRPQAGAAPGVVVMHGSLDVHHLGPTAFGAIRHVTRERPGTIFRFVARKTRTLENFLARAQREIPGFKFEAPGFVAYDKVAHYLADARVGIIPYEESMGTHCAFVAKAVEYVAVGLPAVSTPLKSIRRYFGRDPMVRFVTFDGEDFGRAIVSQLDETIDEAQARVSAERVKAELDWQPLCRKAIAFAERIALAAGAKASVTPVA